MHGETQYIVRRVVREAPGISTLHLSGENGAIPAFSPGQFITVYFPELGTPEGKAYSISSAPGEETFSITVRAIGEFSNRLCGMGVGDQLEASLPYGHFSIEREDSDVVMLASGIGVTPFRSMIFSVLRVNSSRRITLLHSVRTVEDAIFKKEFELLTKDHPRLALSYFVTRGEVPPATALARRMIAGDALMHAPEIENTEFLICGSIPFTRDMWKALRASGVSEDFLYTEAFFSH